MPLSRIRSLLSPRAAAVPRREPTPIPPWLLMPGLAVFVAALAAYFQYLRNYQIWGLDLWVYQGGVHEFLHGRSAYDIGYTPLHLPYTYPPVSMVVFTPLGLMSHDTALYVMLALGVAATFATAWLTLRMLGYTGTEGRIGVSAAVTGLMLWCEPYQLTFNLGQVNILLMLLVVADLALPDRFRGKGALIGLATAVKIVPGIFVLYLILTRRLRAAAVAAGTFVALTLLGWAAIPGGSTDYWLHGLFLQSKRVASVVGPKYVSNQSLHGVAVRLLGDGPAASAVWLLAAVVTLIAGMAFAVWAHRLGEEVLGMLAVAYTGLLLSPIAWSHHWVWLAPLLLVLLDIALRLPGRARTLAAGLPAVVTFVFLSWPIRADRHRPLLAQSLIWKAPHFHPDHSQRYHSPVQVLLGESYTLVTLGLFGLGVLWLRHLQRTAPAATTATTTAAAPTSSTGAATDVTSATGDPATPTPAADPADPATPATPATRSPVPVSALDTGTGDRNRPG
jgi:alpha-1,2-mannosyltransferase